MTGLQGATVGWALCGSHHTLGRVLPVLEEVARTATVIPVISPTIASTQTQYGDPAQWMGRITAAAGRPPLGSIPEVEPFGPGRVLDVLIIAPCTGTSLAKMANAISDTPPLMAAKAQLRNGRPVVLGITTNDALGLNARNLGVLLSARNVFFVPFGQDNPAEKPTSLVAHFELCAETMVAALAGHQLQPLLRPW